MMNAIFGCSCQDTCFSGRVEQKITRPNGDVLDGTFIHGVFAEGKIIRHHAGEILEGTFDNNEQLVKGQIEAKDGTLFIGEFVKEKLEGAGKIIFPGGERVYEGEFEEGLFCSGTITHLREGTVYTGNFADEKLQGLGEIVCKNGESTKGQFWNGQLHGEGTIFDAYQQERVKGIFYNGVLHGKGCMKSPETVQEGTFIHGKLTQGTMTYPDGIIKEGTFDANGQLVHGTIIFSNKDIYEGSFENEKLNGLSRTVIDGVEAKGMFKDGVLQLPKEGSFRRLESRNIHHIKPDGSYSAINTPTSAVGSPVAATHESARVDNKKT